MHAETEIYHGDSGESVLDTEAFDTSLLGTGIESNPLVSRQPESPGFLRPAAGSPIAAAETLIGALPAEVDDETE